MTMLNKLKWKITIMLLFDQESKPMLLDNICTPTSVENFWVLDMGMMDFTLTELNTLEESFSPAFELEIQNFKFWVPTRWNILVYDRDTSQVDIVEIAETAGRDFTAFVYGPKKAKPEPATIKVVNYTPNAPHVYPTMTRAQMLCHPISADEFVVISGTDGYNKYLKNIVVGDLIV